MGDVLPFPPVSKAVGYSNEGLEILKGLAPVKRRSRVTWLGESAAPPNALFELSRILQSNPQLKAMKVLDCYGQEIILWVDGLPPEYG
jgi:hypothetical protein